MAWTCVRCDKRIFEPRKGAIRFAFQWKYIKKHGELFVDLKNLNDLGKRAVVTHLECPSEEVAGFKDRMREKLRMSQHEEHPLLF